MQSVAANINCALSALGRLSLQQNVLVGALPTFVTVYLVYKFDVINSLLVYLISTKTTELWLFFNQLKISFNQPQTFFLSLISEMLTCQKISRTNICNPNTIQWYKTTKEISFLYIENK